VLLIPRVAASSWVSRIRILPEAWAINVKAKSIKTNVLAADIYCGMRAILNGAAWLYFLSEIHILI